jgi:HAD superfamily hydrolase (TIGR01509 family)
MLSGIIFDFDGLILDTEYAIYQAWLEVFKESGGTLTFLDYSKGIGTTPGAFDPVNYLQAQVTAVIDPVETLKRQRVLAHAMIVSQPPLPGVLSLIEQAKARAIKLAIASSSPREWVVGYLSHINLLDRFDAVFCEEDVPMVKPDPGLYLAAMKAIYCPADQVAAFEDSPFGIAAARAADLFCVAVPNRLTMQLDLSQANLIINSIEDLSLDELSQHLVRDRAARDNHRSNQEIL